MIRVQRKRTKGYKLPENTKCVNRGTKWGNPFKVIKEGNYWNVTNVLSNDFGSYQTKNQANKKAIELYGDWLKEELKAKRLDLRELQGKNLACFCSLELDCHADYLIKLINEYE